MHTKKVLIAEHSGNKRLIRNADIHKYRMAEVERFFYGEWYVALCNIHPDVLMKHSKKKGIKMFEDWLEAKQKAEERKNKVKK